LLIALKNPQVWLHCTQVRRLSYHVLPPLSMLSGARRYRNQNMKQLTQLHLWGYDSLGTHCLASRREKHLTNKVNQISNYSISILGIVPSGTTERQRDTSFKMHLKYGSESQSLGSGSLSPPRTVSSSACAFNCMVGWRIMARINVMILDTVYTYRVSVPAS
jgi:hypothetical protein